MKSTLPTIEMVKSGQVPLVRARELYAKTAASKTGLLPVQFSSYTTDELRQVAIDAIAYVNSEQGKAEIKDLSHDLARLTTVVKPFCETLNTHLRPTGNTTLDPTASTFSRNHEINNTLHDIVQLEELSKKGKIPSKEATELFDRIEELLLSAPEKIYKELQDNMSVKKDRSNFDGIADARDLSMTDVCCLVIKDHHAELSKSATAEFGFNVFGFGSRLLNEFENAESAANRRKNVGPAIRKLNDALPAGQRLPGPELATLMRATDTFYVPFPRPDAEEGWVASNGKCKDLLEAIYHNLERGANAPHIPWRMFTS